MNPLSRNLLLNPDSDIEGYQTLFDSMPCIVSVQDRGFRLITVNRNFEREFGRGIGERCFEVYKGRDSVCTNCSVERTFRDGKVHHSEETVVRQSGQEATILVTSAPVFDSEKNVVAAIEMSLDITESRQLQARLRTSEERYRVLFNNQPDPTLVVSLDDLLIVDANDTALADYGYSREELLDIGFLALAPESERRRIKISIEKRERQILKVKQRRRDGSYIWTNVRISYPQHGHAAQNLAIITVTDVTDRLKAEQQLAQASKLTTLGEMAAGVAHELNQPLSVIKSGSTFLSFLAKKVIEKAVPGDSGGGSVVSLQAEVLKSLADEIDGHVDRATRIIQHLRDFGRKSDLTREEVDINDCIRRAFMMLGRQLEGRGITSHFELTEPLPRIMADQNRIEQVLINLILNARDAIEESGVIRDGASGDRDLYVGSSSDGRVVMVTIRDTGCGIREEIQTKIFDPFFTTKEVGKGTGLGLSISYGIVQDYGGRIEVESEPGRGTTFMITFPVSEPDEPTFP